MDSVARLLSSPDGIAVALFVLTVAVLASPTVGLGIFIWHFLRTKNPEPAAKALDRDLESALIKSANEAISALRKTDVYHAHEIAALRERVAKLEARWGEHAKPSRLKR